MCGRSALTIAWARYASVFAAVFEDCLFASVFKTASSLVFASLSTIRRNCAALGPVTHVRVATTPELLGLCEKAGREPPQP